MSARDESEARDVATVIADSDPVRTAVERGYQVVVVVMRVDDTDCGIIASPRRSAGFIGTLLGGASRYLMVADSCACPGCVARRRGEAETARVRH